MSVKYDPSESSRVSSLRRHSSKTHDASDFLTESVVMCFDERLHNANLKARISSAKVVVTTHALSDMTAFLKAALSSILRSLLYLHDRTERCWCHYLRHLQKL